MPCHWSQIHLQVNTCIFTTSDQDGGCAISRDISLTSHAMLIAMLYHDPEVVIITNMCGKGQDFPDARRKSTKYEGHRVVTHIAMLSIKACNQLVSRHALTFDPLKDNGDLFKAVTPFDVWSPIFFHHLHEPHLCILGVKSWLFYKTQAV